MSLFDMLQNPESGQNSGIKGVAIAVVTNNQDEEQLIYHETDGTQL